MKNNFLIIIFLSLLNTHLYSENLSIEAKNITLDKNNKTTIFKDNVSVQALDKKISSEFASYDKEIQKIILKDNVIAQDNFNNLVKAEHAEYDNKNSFFKTIGPTIFISSEKYTLEGKNINFDNKNKLINSDQAAILTDENGNRIYLENFEYSIDENIFKSIGLIKIEDKLNNSYEFSQIYIDTKKKEVLGTDIKAILMSDDFKVNIKNDPRVFANTMKLNKTGSTFNKSVFTLCELKEGQKCPPWTLQASKMSHDNISKTIYYENAVIKVYDIPIFYLPFLSHPDPSVKRRSGFLTPSFSDTKNLGAGITVPYFWAINDDKNFTIKNRLFIDEHPLFHGEYHQAFQNSNFITDFGYTEGYKKSSAKKATGSKTHFFSKFTKNFIGENNSKNSFDINIQNVSNKKYLKLYKIKSNLVDYNKNNLENTLNFNHSKDDLFIGFNTSIYQTLNDSYNDKYEYIFPEIILDKNLMSSNIFGNLDLQSNYKAHNYDTNKLTNFLVNDLNWESNDFILNSKIKNKFIGKIKNINYEAKNIDIYKEDTTNELFGAIGLHSEIDFSKKEGELTQLLTPKILLKLSPGSMRKEEDGYILSPSRAFDIDRLNNINNFETGNSATLGFDFNIKEKNIDKFNFSVAQIINEEENKKHNSKTSLDEKLSDLVGASSLRINNNLELDYNFAIDQNYNEFNFNDFGSKLKFGNLGVNFNYIEENNHIGDKKYFKTKIDFDNQENRLVSFEAKRNLITNSAEFYDLSYEYANDCLRAGLVFRREFYNDSELEPENSLMFNITLVPFGEIDTPKINK